MILRFANCELDVGRVVLRRDGEDLHIEPLAFDVLCFLLERRGGMVRKEELLDHVWGDRFVSESALTTQIRSIRQAVGDDGQRQSVIRTVHGKGYEFVADVVEVGRGEDREDLTANPGTTAGPAKGPTNAPGGRATGGTSASRIPAPVQRLIGRNELLASLVADLAHRRLVTLVGPGGVGKTSVANELARMVEASYGDGVHLVELLTVMDEGATAEALATALDVNTRQQASVDDAIVDMLRPRHALVVLDNCEHLVETVAALVSRILRSAPAVSVLATSREPLAIPAEHVRSVEPLPVDGGPDVAAFDLATVPAVALFLERVRAADPGFELDATTGPAVMEICRRLDGIPLAIELAAARARAIDVSEIARRLDERFRLLRGVRRDTDPRHRTLEDAISWSYDLLSEEERHLFTSLAVFAGQFDLDAAEAVGSGGDVLDLLTRLSERSMLAVRRPESGGTRYELLETLREYGRRHLDDNRSVELHTTHANHFAALARSVETDLQTGDELAASVRADAAFADLRAAQRFAIQVEDVDTAYTLIGATREYAKRALRYEIFAWAAAAAALPGGRGHPLHPLMTGINAYGAWVRGEYDAAVDLALDARSEEQASGALPSGMVERVLANVCYTLGQVDEGMTEARRQITLALDSGNQSRVAHACYMCSVATSWTGDLDEASRLAEMARAASLATGSPTDAASASVAAGFALLDDELALEAFETADCLALAAGNRWMSAFARTEACGVLVRRGRLDEACTALAAMVDVWYRAGEWSQQWHTLTRCVIALHRIGCVEVAAEAVGAIDAHAMMGAPPSMPALRDLTERTLEELQTALGADRAAELQLVGASRPLATMVARVRNALLGRQVDH